MKFSHIAVVYLSTEPEAMPFHSTRDRHRPMRFMAAPYGAQIVEPMLPALLRSLIFFTALAFPFAIALLIN